jgi:hypothetical protein
LQSRSADSAIAALAARQHGRVARWQLLELGVGRRAIGHRVARGWLLVEWPGVYAVGHPSRTLEGRFMAAVLASGPDAVLSHRSAAMLWGIRRTDRAGIEVTTPRDRRPLRGIERHRSSLPPDEVTTHRGIPVTTVPRTLLDLAAVLNVRQFARAVNEVEVQRLWDPLSLNDVVQRHPHRRGVQAIRSILEDEHIGHITRCELEKRFLEFVQGAGLPTPEANAHLYAAGRWFEVDCLWRRDRLRDRALQVAGWRIVRITWRQLHDSAAAVAADLRALLRLARTTAG